MEASDNTREKIVNHFAPETPSTVTKSENRPHFRRQENPSGFKWCLVERLQLRDASYNISIGQVGAEPFE